ncbi:unnamed protein product [Rotaria sp. Silwood1]|nr:unnamed protein product [Rotaria sp. Silwood1]
MPYIQSGSYNAKTKKIEINVRYSGGCAKHKFRLKVDTCRESYPVQCDATLIDLTTGDFCKALIHRKISISLHEAGLDNNYYKGASIRIRGADLASVDETISLNYEEDDIRLCTMQRAISEQKLGFFSCYHRKERFHYVKFYGDWKSRSEFTLPRQLICDVFSNKFPSLRYVNMSCIDESTYNLWTTSPSLQYVSILSCKLMSIPSILAACPNLHHLQVRLLYNNDNIITLSSPVNHSLRRLTLWSNYTELTFNDIDNILTYTPNLEHLYLQTVYHMPFIHLANGLINRLHHLSRFDCYIREILPRDDPIGNLTSDGKELIRIPASITGKDPPINDWTLVNVILPNEKIQVSIQLNFTEGLIAFNDIAVDYCDRPRPLPSKSLPQYPYEWSILKASNTIQIEHEASSVDYTFGNASRHYALLPNSKTVV